MFARTFQNRLDAHTDVTSPTRFVTSQFTSVPFPVFAVQMREGGFNLDYKDFNFITVTVELDMVSEGHTITLTHDGRTVIYPVDSATAVDVIGVVSYYKGKLQNHLFPKSDASVNLV